MELGNTDYDVDNSDVTLADMDTHMNMNTKMDISEDLDEDIDGDLDEDIDSEVFNEVIQHQITKDEEKMKDDKTRARVREKRRMNKKLFIESMKNPYSDNLRRSATVQCRLCLEGVGFKNGKIPTQHSTVYTGKGLNQKVVEELDGDMDEMNKNSLFFYNKLKTHILLHEPKDGISWNSEIYKKTFGIHSQ